MPLLTDLDAEFVRWDTTPEVDAPRGKGFRTVATKAEAHGVKFLCPKCFVANGGAVGTHSIICWSESAGAPAEAVPGPGRWKMDGTDMSDLTLNADPPRIARSVALRGGCAWHGFVTAGEAE